MSAYFDAQLGFGETSNIIPPGALDSFGRHQTNLTMIEKGRTQVLSLTSSSYYVAYGDENAPAGPSMPPWSPPSSGSILNDFLQQSSEHP